MSGIDGMVYQKASASAVVTWPTSLDIVIDQAGESQVFIEWRDPDTGTWSERAVVGALRSDRHVVVVEDLAPGRYRFSVEHLYATSPYRSVVSAPFDLHEGESAEIGLTLLPASSRPGIPTNLTPPKVTGEPKVGAVWTADPGTWTESPTIGIFWLRCDHPVASYASVPSGCVAISGATGASYVATSADTGRYLTAQIAATGSAGFALAGAANSIAIESHSPRNIAPPRVSGAFLVGSTWTVDTGSWAGSPEPMLVIAWLRCGQPVTQTFMSVPLGCVAIPGANGVTYTTVSADVGAYVTAQIAANNNLGFALSGAVSTTRIEGDISANTVPPSIAGTRSVGSTLTVDVGQWTGAPTFAIVWLRCSHPQPTVYTLMPAGCAPIPGANAMHYQVVAADAGRYLTAQVAGNGPYGFTLAGAPSPTAIEGGVVIPGNVVPPNVSGAPLVGSELVMEHGVWTGSPTFATFWLRCDRPQLSVYTIVPAGCVAIPGAKGETYVVVRADTGKYLTAQVAGNSPYGFTLAGAISTSAVISDIVLPVNTTPPSVSGSPSVGSVWTVDTGAWFGSPTLAIYWLRCDHPISAGYTTVPSGCTPIGGANSTTYVSTQSDVGSFLTAQVAGNSPVGFSLAGAVNMAAVVSSAPTNTMPPSVTGSPLVGSVWTVDTGSWTGSPAPTIVISWLRCSQPLAVGFTTVPSGCAAIPGANSASYTAVSADAGRYLTAQVAGNSSLGFALAGAVNTVPIQAPGG